MYMKYRFRHICSLPFLLLLLLPLFCTCSDEEPVGPQPGEFKTLDFHLMLTSAEGDTNHSTPYEGMTDVWLVILDNNGKILQKHYEELKQEDTKSAILEKTIRLDRVDKAATYVYAFSNLKSELLLNSEEILKALEVGKMLPVEFESNGALAGHMPNAQIVDNLRIGNNNIATSDPESPPIPMSSHFHKLDDKEIRIPLYRMIVKVKMSILNESGVYVDISPVDLQKFRNKSPIYTLPYKSLMDIKEEDLPLFPDASLELEASFGVLVNQKLDHGKSVEHIFYVHETLLKGDSIKVSIGFNAPEAWKGTRRVGVTNFTYVRRNDFLVLPLVLSEYSLEVSVSEQRAPIGGYPFMFKMDLITNETYFIRNKGDLTIDLKVLYKGLSGSMNTPVGDFSVDGWSLESDGDAIRWKSGSPPAESKVSQIELMVTERGSAKLSFTVSVKGKNIPYSINLVYN